MKDIVIGKILEVHEDGGVLIAANVPSLDRAILRQYSDVEIGFTDGRQISASQRRKTYALIHEISEWMGEHDEITKKQLKLDFKLNRMQGLQRKLFSLSDVDMTTAREFICFLIDFVLENDIPTSQPLQNLCDDIGKYVYSCLMNRRCAVCGLAADIHHVTGSKIGMGGDREEVHHLGRDALPLCRVHHTECHNDEKTFIQKYHLQTVKLDEALCKQLKLKK